MVFERNIYHLKNIEQKNLNEFFVKKQNDSKLKKRLIDNYLNKNNYFFIHNIDAKTHKEFEKKIIHLSSLFGPLVSQNSKKQKIIKIQVKKDYKKKTSKKYSLKNKLRYHQTNTGGSIHTDGPQLNTSPKVLIMGCSNQSADGGESIIVNGKKIFNKLKIKEQKALMQKFYFERRGFDRKIFKKSIFERDKKIFIFRYLKEYLLKAYELKKLSLTKYQIYTLKRLDSLLNKKSNQMQFKLKKNQVVVINNHICAHGRKKFKIQGENPRLLYRLWVK
jgi:hypothetical protein